MYMLGDISISRAGQIGRRMAHAYEVLPKLGFHEDSTKIKTWQANSQIKHSILRALNFLRKCIPEDGFQSDFPDMPVQDLTTIFLENFMLTFIKLVQVESNAKLQRI